MLQDFEMLIHLDLVLFMRKSWKKGMGKNKASLMLLLVGFYTGTFQKHINQEKDNGFAQKLKNKYFNIKMGYSRSVRK